MDLTLFTNLIRNLLQVTVFDMDNFHVDKEERLLQAFEAQYYFHSKLQPMFTVQTLSYLIQSMQENTFYEIIDSLEVSLLFFRFADRTFFVGPYAKKQYEDNHMQALLAENQVPASYALPLKLYYTALPLLGSLHIQRVIAACMESFSPGGIGYSYRRLKGFKEEGSLSSPFPAEPIDYSIIYGRYDRENHFLKMIETGNVENVLPAYYEMGLSRQVDSYILSSNVYQNPLTAMSIVRVLARKAAENGGLSVVRIDEITQNAVQKMTASQNYRELVNITCSMLLDLTQAVRDHQKSSTGYSRVVSQIADFLSDNYSQEISLSFLADMAHFSESHLSKTFKRETGVTISQYIARLRCNTAAKLLRETELSIQEISGYVGYPDNNYFVKVFKGQFGVTPSAYRNKGG